MTLNHIKILSEENCHLCGSKNMILFFEILNVPVHYNLLWKNRKEAQKCTRGDIKLVFCPNCSYITNITFEQEKTKYSQAYDNSLHFSPFRARDNKNY
jgi:hypothetical protein